MRNGAALLALLASLGTATAAACQQQPSELRVSALSGEQGVASLNVERAGPLQERDTATFAGGCFWCMEPPFDKLARVLSTTSGYIGGPEQQPTYEEVSSGRTGHTEAVQIVFDPAQVTYGRLLQVFWRNIDPLVENRQFCDVGAHYRSGIFYHDAEQHQLAEATKAAIEESGQLDGPIVTEITEATTFWPAEEYHQDYYMKNPVRYRFYRYSCGRDRRLEQIWG